MTRPRPCSERPKRPIIFSGPMVRAILENRKTQTRRVVKPQPEKTGDGWLYRGQFFGDDEQMQSHLFHDVYGADKGMPYGGVYGDGSADRLWVRESYQQASAAENTLLTYKADIPDIAGQYRWKPAIHMPRWASRLTLELTDVRVERLQAITAEDVYREGAMLLTESTFGDEHVISRFAQGWDVLNARRGYPFDSNPWVWVLSFRVFEVTQ